MENYLFYLLFLAALFHALWNTIIKTSKDPLLGMALLQIFMGGMCLPLLFFVPLLNKEAWPFLQTIELKYQKGLPQLPPPNYSIKKLIFLKFLLA